jgi:hypothetical protein
MRAGDEKRQYTPNAIKGVGVVRRKQQDRSPAAAAQGGVHRQPSVLLRERPRHTARLDEVARKGVLRCGDCAESLIKEEKERLIESHGREGNAKRRPFLVIPFREGPSTGPRRLNIDDNLMKRVWFRKTSQRHFSHMSLDL